MSAVKVYQSVYKATCSKQVDAMLRWVGKGRCSVIAQHAQQSCMSYIGSQLMRFVDSDESGKQLL